MKKSLIIGGVVIFLSGCHDKSDHNIKAPVPDSVVELNQKPAKDTSVHSGTIPAIARRMTTELELVPRVIGPGEAFAQLMIIHRKAVLEMSRIEVSEGNRKDIFEEALKIQSRSYKLLASLEAYLGRHVPGRKSNDLRYSMPVTEEKMQRLVHSGPGTDQLFVQMVAAVDKSEIVLARSYLKEGKNRELRIIANQIITINQEQIASISMYKFNNTQ